MRGGCRPVSDKRVTRERRFARWRDGVLGCSCNVEVAGRMGRMETSDVAAQVRGRDKKRENGERVWSGGVVRSTMHRGDEWRVGVKSSMDTHHWVMSDFY